MNVTKLNRREFLRVTAASAAGVTLVACQPQTVIVKETVEVEKVVKETVKETVVVEATVAPAEHEAPDLLAQVSAGTLAQCRDEKSLTCEVLVRHGRLRLKTLAVSVGEAAPKAVRVAVGGDSVQATFKLDRRQALVELSKELTLQAGERIEVVLA